MDNFWGLAGFEFKKIFQRKISLVSVLICLGVIAVTVFASVSSGSFWHKVGNNISQFEAMKLDKATIISNRGYITPELVSEAIMSNREMISNDDNYFSNEYGRHLKEDAYIEYILPYESVVNLINIIYADDLDWLSMGRIEIIIY